MGTSIKKRPQIVKKREEFGHWELDTVLSGRGISKEYFATFVERKTRHYFTIKIIDRTGSSFYKDTKHLVSLFPSGTFKTFTTDRGKEFACYTQTESELKIDVYFDDPYCSWQRGTNENSNGLLRDFFPKRTNLSLITQKETDHALTLLHNRPRKGLGFKTTLEVFNEEVSHLI